MGNNSSQFFPGLDFGEGVPFEYAASVRVAEYKASPE
jgi:hypothetical protein